MCGGSMRLKEAHVVVQVPGNPRATTARQVEWICPDCDYYEEAEEEKD
jgi:hypothetical protein